MFSSRQQRWSFIASLLSVASGAIAAQPGASTPTAAPRPAPPSVTGVPAKADQRIGDPFPLDTCPITGIRLDSGQQVVKLYDGREVRFSSADCPARFEKDLPGEWSKIDAKIIKDQGPLYPLKTSLVTGKPLPEKPFEFVYGNRLVRLGVSDEKAEFLKDAPRFLAALNKAVVDQQIKDYAPKTCPVSDLDYNEDAAKRVDYVLAGRLIRLCCKDCQRDVERHPARYIIAADAARKAKADAAPKIDKGDKPKDAKP